MMLESSLEQEVFENDMRLLASADSLPWSELKSEFSNVRTLGLVPYLKARAIQNELVAQNISSHAQDLFLVCEHPPTLSFGKRIAITDEFAPWSAAGIELVDTDRGGEISFHGPGQLIVYPVVSLKRRSLGVKAFVTSIYQIIVDSLMNLGVEASHSLEPNGVWTKDCKKIAACGLKIERGVTNHGFSLNLNSSLIPYKYFNACGQGLPATNLKEVLSEKGDCLDLGQLFKALVTRLSNF